MYEDAKLETNSYILINQKEYMQWTKGHFLDVLQMWYSEMFRIRVVA